MKNRNVLSFLIGAAIGAGVSWLLFSDEGKELRNKIKEKTDGLKDDFAGDWDEVKSVLRDLLADVETESRQNEG